LPSQGRDGNRRQPYDVDKTGASQIRLVAAGNAYADGLRTLTFPGWTLATGIPEAEFLGPIGGRYDNSDWAGDPDPRAGII